MALAVTATHSTHVTTTLTHTETQSIQMTAHLESRVEFYHLPKSVQKPSLAVAIVS